MSWTLPALRQEQVVALFAPVFFRAAYAVPVYEFPVFLPVSGTVPLLEPENTEVVMEQVCRWVWNKENQAEYRQNRTA